MCILKFYMYKIYTAYICYYKLKIKNKNIVFIEVAKKEHKILTNNVSLLWCVFIKLNFKTENISRDK